MLTRRQFLGGAACSLCSAGAALAGLRLGRDVVTAGHAAPAARAAPDGSTAGAPARRETKTFAARRSAQPNGLFRIATRERVVAMTFDDGPDPRYTSRVLGWLKEHDAAATFFLIGTNALAYPELSARIRAEGHVAANHTYDHPDLEVLAPPQIAAEIERGAAALERAGFARPTLFRPPKGYTDPAIGVLADADRYRTVFWDLCVEHFIDHGPVEEGVSRLIRRVRPGSIILAHDGGHVVGARRAILSRQRTMEAIPLVLRGLATAGYQVLDVDRLASHRSPAGSPSR